MNFHDRIRVSPLQCRDDAQAGRDESRPYGMVVLAGENSLSRPGSALMGKQGVMIYAPHGGA
jgi:hypothetical protein